MFNVMSHSSVKIRLVLSVQKGIWVERYHLVIPCCPLLREACGSDKLSAWERGRTHRPRCRQHHWLLDSPFAAGVQRNSARCGMTGGNRPPLPFKIPFFISIFPDSLKLPMIIFPKFPQFSGPDWHC